MTRATGWFFTILGVGPLVRWAYAAWASRQAFGVRRPVYCRRHHGFAHVVAVHDRVEGRCIGVVGCSLWLGSAERGCAQQCIADLGRLSPRKSS